MYIVCVGICIYLRSREPLLRFSQNLVLDIFRARQNDLDRSQPYKEACCLSACNSILEHKSRKSRETLKLFYKIWYYIYFEPQKII